MARRPSRSDAPSDGKVGPNPLGRNASVHFPGGHTLGDDRTRANRGTVTYRDSRENGGACPYPDVLTYINRGDDEPVVQNPGAVVSVCVTDDGQFAYAAPAPESDAFASHDARSSRDEKTAEVHYRSRPDNDLHASLDMGVFKPENPVPAYVDVAIWADVDFAYELDSVKA